MKGSIRECRLGVAVLVIAAWSLAPARATVIYQENYESLTAATVHGQGGWSVIPSGEAADANVVSDGGTAYAGTQFLSMGNAGLGPRVIQVGFSGTSVNTTREHELSTALRFTETGHNGMQLILNGDGGPNYAVHTFFNAAGGLYQVSGYSTYNYLGASILPDEWYNVTYRIAAGNTAYNFTVVRASDSSVIISTNLPYAAGSPISSTWDTIDLRVDAAAGNAWLLDNTSFSEVIPEPSAAILLANRTALVVMRRLRRRRS